MKDSPLVIHVLWTLGRAGAERVVLELAKRLPSHGYETRVIAVGGGGPLETDFKAAGIPVAVAPPADRWHRFRTVRFLREQIRMHRPAIWHTHLGADVWGGWAAQSERFHPWIITAHNDDRDLGMMQRLLRRNAFRSSDRVVCVSDAVRAFVKNQFRVLDARLSVIRNGIDIGIISRREHGGLHDPPRLLSVGRLSAQKNHKLLLSALALLKKKAWTLSIVGEGQEGHRLKDVSRALGIADRVTFVGSVADPSVLMSQSDVFCFPSRWEGQGLAMLEAAAAGVPIIASPLPVFRERFDDTAVLYAFSHSRKAWAQAIDRMLTHYADAIARAEQARQVVLKQFSVERMAKEYAELYRGLISEER